jgi:hypothetical protein
MDTRSAVEFSSPVYDIITAKTDNGGTVFCIAVDVSRAAVESGFAARFLHSFHSILKDLPDDCSVQLLTFDSGVTIYDTVKRRCYTVSDVDDFALVKPTFQPLAQTRDYLLNVVGNVRLTSKKGSNWKNALIIARFLLEDRGGIVVASLKGCPSDVPARSAPTIMFPEEQSSYRDIAFGLSSDSICVTMFVELQGQVNELCVTAVPAGLTSGSCFVVKSEAQLAANLSRVLFDRYTVSSVGKLRAPPGVRVLSHLGNCVIRRNNVSMFGCMPSLSAITYHLQVVQRLEPQIVLQFALQFMRDDGFQVTRVFTFPVQTGSNFHPMGDGPAMTALICKKGLSILLDENIESARSFVQKFAFAAGLLDTVAFSVDPLAADQQIADVVFLRKATVEEVMLYLKPRVFVLPDQKGRIEHRNDGFYVFIDPEDDEMVFGPNRLDGVAAFVEESQRISGRRLGFFRG